jgi:hypothetical protein
MMGIAEFIIGRAFARDPLAQPILQKRKQVIAGRVLKDCGNRGPPTRTIILAIRGFYELWCITTGIVPKVP